MKYVNHLFRQLMLVLLLTFSGIAAFAQINVSVQVLRPYHYRITDYASHPEQILITLVNTSLTQQRIQLRGSVVGDNGVSMRVKQSYKNKNVIIMEAGGMMLLNGSDLPKFFDIEQLDYIGISADRAFRGNGLPEGNYQLCIRAYNYDTNAPLSTGEPGGCSNSFGITNLEPPVIIGPYDKQEVSTGNVQLLNLSWTTPPGAPPTVMYRVRISEIMGNGNPNDAIRSTVQPVFFEKEVMGNIYVYNPGDPQLTPGRRYAMMVTAFAQDGGLNFRNNGQSAVTSFTNAATTTSPSLATINSTNPPVTATPQAEAVAVNPLVQGNLVTQTLANSIKITGKIGWKAPAAQATRTLSSVSNTPKLPVAKSLPYNYAVQPFSVKLITTEYTLKGVDIKLLKGTLKEQNISAKATNPKKTETLLSSGVTNDNGEFTATVSNPAAEEANTHAAASASGLYNAPKATQTVKVRFFKTLVSVGTDRFAMRSDEVVLPSKDALDFKVLEAIPKTFRFTPTVVSPTGAALANVKVEVLRETSFYDTNPGMKDEQYLYSSPTLKAPITYNGVSYAYVGLPPRPDGSVMALFNNSENDNYTVIVSADGCDSYVGTIKSVPNSNVVTEKYTLTATAPVWKGRITQTSLNQTFAVANALIKLTVVGRYWKKSAGPMAKIPISVKTDAQGNFNMPLTADFVPNPTPMEYAISGISGIADFNGATGTVVINTNGASVKEINLTPFSFNITGNVTDENGKRLSAVSLTLKSTKATKTNQPTGFNITSTSKNDSLTVAVNGYNSTKVPVTYISGTAVRLGDIKLQPRYLYKLTVKGLDGKPVPFATIILNRRRSLIFASADTPTDTVGFITNSNGEITARLPKNTYVTFNVETASGSKYIGRSGFIKTQATNSNMAASVYDAKLNADVITQSILLDYSVTIQGVVTDTQNNPVAGATVKVGALGYLSTVTNDKGVFKLRKAQGFDTLISEKTGYRLAKISSNYTADAMTSLKMQRTDVKSLLGLPVNVTSQADGPNGTLLVTGSFTNLPGNGTFTPDPKAELKFSKVKVKFVGDKAVLDQPNIKTENDSLKLSVFGYMSGWLINSSKITMVKGATDDSFTIEGSVSVDLDAFPNAKEFGFEGTRQVLTASGTASKNYQVLGTSITAPDKLYFVGNSSFLCDLNKIKFYAYPSASSIQSNGIHLAGHFDLTEQTGIQGTNFAATDVLIDKTGKRGNTITLDANKNYFDIDKWNIKLSEASFASPKGVSLKGLLNVTFKGSTVPLKANFSSLLINDESILGGVFKVDGDSFDLGGPATYSVDTKLPWKLIKEEDDSYSFENGGDIKLKKAIVQKIPVNKTSFGTDGSVSLDAPLNVKLIFEKLAKINLTSLTYVSAEDSHIDINGGVEITINEHVKAKAGDFKFYKNKVTVGQISAGIECGEMAEGKIEFEFSDTDAKRGFSGAGEITIEKMGTLALGATYYQTPIGTIFGGKFEIGGKKMIAIGQTGLGFKTVGGDFTYNTGKKEWEFGVNGKITDIADVSKIETEVRLGVTAGPVITGTATATYEDNFKLAEGSIIIDIPNKQGTISIKPDFGFLPGVAVAASGFARIGSDDGSGYMFAGITSKMNAFGIFKANATACIGVNYKFTPKNIAAVSDYYGTLADVFKKGGKITGYNIKANGGYNYSWNKTFVNIGLASATGRFSTKFSVDGLVYGSFSDAELGASFNTSWGMSAGVDLSLIGFSVANFGGGVEFSAGLAGKLNFKEKYVVLNANAQGKAYFTYYKTGCSNDAGARWKWIFPIGFWARGCISPSVSVGFDSRKSNPVSLSF